MCRDNQLLAMITAGDDSLQPPAHDWQKDLDWQRCQQESVGDATQLLTLLGLHPEDLGVSPEALAQFPLRVPQSFIARMRVGDPSDPLLRQVLPIAAEMAAAPVNFSWDAVGDHQAERATGVLQKYPGRALLICTGHCAIHCRYCFRRHFPYAEQTAARQHWSAAIDLIAQDSSLKEIILSGGDPLSLVTSKLARLTDALSQITHIQRLRIHTRLPIVLPERVNAPLSQWLSQLPWPVVIVVHANHANEFAPDVDRAMRVLRQTGATLLNQAVLLRGINDTAEALIQLSERSFQAGVLPYYIHQLDRVIGAAHFEVDDQTALALIMQMRERLSGYLVPKLVREVAGDLSKRPITRL